MISLENKLVIAISSRAVFDFEEENRVFEQSDDRAYRALQRERLDQAAKPGVAFALVRKLLAFDPEQCADRERRVEVVVVSRNDPVSGMRVFRSAQQMGLRLERGVFTRGRKPWPYLEPLKANLFLSANEQDVREALEAGFPAARVFPRSVQASVAHPEELRIAFDGDAVLFPMRANSSSSAKASVPFRRMSASMPPDLCPAVPSSRCSKPCIGCTRRQERRCGCVQPWSRHAARLRTSAPFARCLTGAWRSMRRCFWAVWIRAVF